MTALLHNLIIVPLLLPLVTAALLLLAGEERRRLRSLLNVFASMAGLVVAIGLIWAVHDGGNGSMGVYLASNWQAPFGIVLVADRLSVLMLLLVGIVSTGAALYSEAGWSRAGAYFHPLFQIQLFGLNGAFLTGDLFNLFVFFEVLLVASYGLQLHGSGRARVRFGMYYIVVNLLASSLFLVGLAVMYGVVGTLNMADLADKVALVAEADRGLLHVGAALLAVAFLIKAAIWPLNSWLVPAYVAAGAPVAALFVLMTKVGFYAVLRLWTLIFSEEAGVSARFGADALLIGGLATLLLGSLGLLATIRLERIAAYAILVSAGTLMAALGMNSPVMTSAALFYLIGSTFAASMLFLLVELVKRTGVDGPAQLSQVDIVPDEDDNLDDQELPLVGRPFPISVAFLGLAFVTCALLIAGLPPLAGFLAKVALLNGITSATAGISTTGWILVSLLLISSLSATMSLARAGIRHFWLKGERFAPQLKMSEGSALVILLVAGLWLSAAAEPVMRYTAAAAQSLHSPRAYIDGVLGARPVPSPSTSRPSSEEQP